MRERCPDCGVEIGEKHLDGCDVERCPNCGRQLITCGCSDEEVEKAGRMSWAGVWPGVMACRKHNLWVRWGPGWIKCDKHHEGAREDLSALLGSRFTWDKEQKDFVEVNK